MPPNSFGSILGALFLIGVVALVWPRSRTRAGHVFVATLGGLSGSLVGRIAANPSWVGHLLFVAAGAIFFSALDWMWSQRGHAPSRR